MRDRFYEGSLFTPFNLWAALKKLILNKVNWLPVFFLSLIRFWLILNPHFLQLANSSVSLDSYTTNTLSSLGDFAPGDNGQAKLSKSLLDLSSKKNSTLPRSHHLDLADLLYKIQNTCSLYVVWLNKNNRSW